jgi:hypothetical protein
MIPVRDLFESHLVNYFLKHPVTAVADVRRTHCNSG